MNRIVRIGLMIAVFIGYALVFVHAALAAADDGGVVPDNNVGRWSFLIGVFLPLAIAAVNRQAWSSQLKGIATFVCSAIAALGTSYFAGDLGTEDIVTSLLIILVAATVTYRTFWQPSGIAPKIESVTG